MHEETNPCAIRARTVFLGKNLGTKPLREVTQWKREIITNINIETKLLRRLLFLAWMFQRCESLQEQCRRVVIQAVGSRKLLYKLPLPRNIIAWLKEYEEPVAFDPNCSSDQVVFSNNNETITFNGQLQTQIYWFKCFVIYPLASGN